AGRAPAAAAHPPSRPAALRDTGDTGARSARRESPRLSTRMGSGTPAGRVRDLLAQRVADGLVESVEPAPRLLLVERAALRACFALLGPRVTRLALARVLVLVLRLARGLRLGHGRRRQHVLHRPLVVELGLETPGVRDQRRPVGVARLFEVLFGREGVAQVEARGEARLVLLGREQPQRLEIRARRLVGALEAIQGV